MNNHRPLPILLCLALLLPALAQAAPWAEVRYAHDVVNVRAGRSTDTAIVTHLEPGQKVVASFPLEGWLAVFSPDRTGRNLSEAMGYVLATLLHPAPPQTGDVTAAQAGPSIPAATWNGVRLHARARTNVRAARSAEAPVVGQLAQGEAVVAGFPKDHWLAVFRPGQDTTGPPLGYVFAELLTDIPPAPATAAPASEAATTGPEAVVTGAAQTVQTVQPAPESIPAPEKPLAATAVIAPPPAITPTPASAPPPGPDAAVCSGKPGPAPVERFVAAAANLRAGPSPDAGVVALLRRGERLLVVDCPGAWSAVLSPDTATGVATPLRKGFVHASLLTDTQPQEISTDPAPMRAKVRTNLRASRDLQATVVGVLEPGQRVIAGFYAHDWYAVFPLDVPATDEHRALGYAFAPLLEPAETQAATPAAPAPQAASPAPPARTAMRATVRAKIRAGRGTDFAVTGMLEPDESMAADAAIDGWAAVYAPGAARADAPKGYVFAALLAPAAAPDAPATPADVAPVALAMPDTRREAARDISLGTQPEAVETRPELAGTQSDAAVAAASPAPAPPASTETNPALTEAEPVPSAQSEPLPADTSTADQPGSPPLAASQAPAGPARQNGEPAPAAPPMDTAPDAAQQDATPGGGTLMTATATINVRAARSTEAAIVKMIEQGQEVMAAFPKSGWFAVFEPSQEPSDEQYAMGYVYGSLLKPSISGDKPLVGVPVPAPATTMPRPPADIMSPGPAAAPAAPPAPAAAAPVAPGKSYTIDAAPFAPPAPTSPAAAPDAPQPSRQAGQRLHATGVVNIRSAPTTASRATGRLEKGAVVLAAEPQDDWCAVYPPDSGMAGAPMGFVSARFLAPLATQRDTPAQNDANGTTGQDAESEKRELPHKIIEEHQEGAAKIMSILLEVDTLPADERLKRLGQRLWFKQMAACDTLHLYIYLPGLDIKDPAYAVASFSKTEPASFRTRQSVLYGTRWRK